jgi:hypothetical protein
MKIALMMASLALIVGCLVSVIGLRMAEAVAERETG